MELLYISGGLLPFVLGIITIIISFKDKRTLPIILAITGIVIMVRYIYIDYTNNPTDIKDYYAAIISSIVAYTILLFISKEEESSENPVITVYQIYRAGYTDINGDTFEVACIGQSDEDAIKLVNKASHDYFSLTYLKVTND